MMLRGATAPGPVLSTFGPLCRLIIFRVTASTNDLCFVGAA